MNGGLPFQAVIGNLLGIQSHISWGYHFNWYIGGLVLFYLLAPLFKKITDRTKTLAADILITLVLVLSSIPFWYNSALITVIRLPLLYLGMVYSKYAKRGYTLRLKDLTAHAVLLAIGLVLVRLCMNCGDDICWACGLYWYPFILVVPSLCILFSYAIALVEKIKLFSWLYRFLCFIGTYSFEIYLVHLFLYEGLMPGIEVQFKHINNQLLWWSTIPVIVVGTFLLNRISVLVSNAFSKLTAKAR